MFFPGKKFSTTLRRSGGVGQGVIQVPALADFAEGSNDTLLKDWRSLFWHEYLPGIISWCTYKLFYPRSNIRLVHSFTVRIIL